MSALDNIHEVDNVRDLPLPHGWTKELDPNDRPFWVDTHSEFRRCIRVHPYEDKQYLREHPEIREKIARLVPPSYAAAAGSGSGTHSETSSEERGSSPNQARKKKKRGVFGKMKDKAIGTKEERAESKRQHAIREEQRRRRREQEWLAYQQQYIQQHGEFPPPPGYGYGPGGGFYGSRGSGGYGVPLAGGIAGGLLLGSILAALGGC